MIGDSSSLGHISINVLMLLDSSSFSSFRNLFSSFCISRNTFPTLSDLYTEMGRWSDVEKVRGLTEERGLQKELGRRFLKHKLQDSFPESRSSSDCASEREDDMISSSILCWITA